MACREPDRAVETLHGAPDRGLVGQRLAQSHEHHVRDTASVLAGSAGRPHDLLDDLTDGEMPGETCLAGGAEATAHGAAGLGRHTDRGPIRIQHEHGLDRRPTVEVPQELDGVAALAHPFGDRSEGVRQIGLEPFA